MFTSTSSPLVPKEDFYLVVGRFTWYKRMDLAGGGLRPAGQTADRHRRRRGGSPAEIPAGPTVQFLGGGLSDEEIRGYYLRAKAFLFPGEEDFGITPVEAQSAGYPGAGLRPGRCLRERGRRGDGSVLRGTDGGVR